MNALADALKKYLQLRRNLGSKLQGVDRPLRDFVAFAKREGSSHITTDLALRWAQQPVHVQPVTWASRLRLVRGFALWLSATDPCTEVPPAGLLPYRYQRQPPYIYSDAQIAAIVRAAGRLVSPKGLRGRTYSTIFGLLSVSGMRVSEALALDRQDVDLEQGILRDSGDEVPQVSAGSLARVDLSSPRRLCTREGSCCSPARYGSLLSVGKWYPRDGVRHPVQLRPSVPAVGLRQAVPGRRHGRGPRLHDLRHRFAVRTLVDWYRTGSTSRGNFPSSRRTWDMSTSMTPTGTSRPFRSCWSWPHAGWKTGRRLIHDQHTQISRNLFRLSSRIVSCDNARPVRRPSPDIEIPFGCSCGLLRNA